MEESPGDLWSRWLLKRRCGDGLIAFGALEKFEG
jgi:hypothetical protein